MKQLTVVRVYGEVMDAPPPGDIRSTRAMEGVMPKENLWNKSVPRVEYDHRAREARLQLERVERLLVKHYAVKDTRPFRLLRLLAYSIFGRGRRGGRSTGSPSDRRPCDFSAPPLTPTGRRTSERYPVLYAGGDKIRFGFAIAST